MTLGGRARRRPDALPTPRADSGALHAAAATVLAAAYGDALGGLAPGAEPLASAFAVLAAHAGEPVAQAAHAVAGLLAVPGAREVSWSRALSALADSLPASLTVDGTPRGGTGPGLPGDATVQVVAPSAELAGLLGAVALARIAARRAGAPFPRAVDRPVAAGVQYLAVRSGLEITDAPRPPCERGATWCDPAFLLALARAWGMLPEGVAPHADVDPRLGWFGVVPRRGHPVPLVSGAVSGSVAEPVSPIAVTVPRRAGRARAESGPTWRLHAFHAAGCVVAQELARSPSRVVVACDGTHGVALAWERADGTILTGRLPGCDDARLVRARVDGRRLTVDGAGRCPGTRRTILRSVRVQPGRWRVVDRLDAASSPDEKVAVRLAWRLGAGWRIVGGLVRREGPTPVVECRACCGEEELLVQLPAALDWVVSGGDSGLEGSGHIVAGALLASSFELRARGGPS